MARRGWYEALVDALQEEDNPVMQLATIDPATNTPRVRTIVHRAFQTARAHPGLPLILSTTDVRTPKVAQLHGARAQGRGRANPDPAELIELVYWTPRTQAQFRIRGRVSIVPARGYGGEYGPYPALPGHVGGEGDGDRGGDRVGVVYEALKEQGFDWERERVVMFDRMSAHLRATWCRPVPGTPLREVAAGGAKEGVEGVEGVTVGAWPATLPRSDGAASEAEAGALAVALSNFALVVVEPFEVDCLELGVLPNRRTRYVREDARSVAFKETLVVP